MRGQPAWIPLRRRNPGPKKPERICAWVIPSVANGEGGVESGESMAHGVLWIGVGAAADARRTAPRERRRPGRPGATRLRRPLLHELVRGDEGLEGDDRALEHGPAGEVRHDLGSGGARGEGEAGGAAAGAATLRRLCKARGGALRSPSGGTPGRLCGTTSRGRGGARAWAWARSRPEEVQEERLSARPAHQRRRPGNFPTRKMKRRRCSWLRRELWTRSRI